MPDGHGGQMQLFSPSEILREHFFGGSGFGGANVLDSLASGKRNYDLGNQIKKGTKRVMIVKIQAPAASGYPMLVYNEKRTFKCVLKHEDDPAAYDIIYASTYNKGIRGNKASDGAKAYFQSELDGEGKKLSVKISEAVAQQPW